MYQTFYHLHRAPFQLTVDPDFFWAGAKYENALEAMRYGLEHRGGLTLLTGEAGVGKTAVVQALFRRLEDQRILTAMIPDPCLTELEFFNLVLAALGAGAQVGDREEFHRRLLEFLGQRGDRDHKVLLVIDEAQRLAGSVVREIEAMLELGSGPAMGLCICLVGRINDSRALMELVGGAFSDRVTVTCHLTPLSLEESASYVRHRLQVAGAESEIFTEDALQEVHRFTGGYPGLINGLCDFALFSAYNQELAQVTAEVVRRSGANLRLAEGGENCAAEGEVNDGSGSIEAVEPGGDDVDAGCVAADSGGIEAGPGDDDLTEQEAAGADNTQRAVRRGRFVLISSVGAVAMVVLLVGGFLYSRGDLHSGWTLPVEPPSAGPPAAALERQAQKEGGGPAPSPDLAAEHGQATGPAGPGAVPESVAGRKDEARADRVAGVAADMDADKGTEVPGEAPAAGPDGVGPAAADMPAPGSGGDEPPVPSSPTAAPAAGPDAGQQLVPPVAVTGTEQAEPDSVPAAPQGPESAAERQAEIAAPPVAADAGQVAPVPAAAELVPAPEAGSVGHAQHLSPALKALLSGGSLAGGPTVERLPDLKIRSAPVRAPAPVFDQETTDPDPSDVIDWLLKKKHKNDPGR